MKNLEKASLDEYKELVHRLEGKTVEEMIAIFGRSVREHGREYETFVSRRNSSGVVFHDVGPTVHRLVVTSAWIVSSSSACKKE